MENKYLDELLHRLGSIKAAAGYVGKPYDTVRRWKQRGVPKIRRELVACKLVDLLMDEARLR